MPKPVHHPYMLSIQPTVCVSVYYVQFCFWEITSGFFNSYIPGKIWRWFRSNLLWPLGVEPQMILEKTSIIFGLIILVLDSWLLSRCTGSQYRIAAITVSTFILCVIMSILKLTAMKRLDFLHWTSFNFILTNKNPAIKVSYQNDVCGVGRVRCMWLCMCVCMCVCVKG